MWGFEQVFIKSVNVTFLVLCKKHFILQTFKKVHASQKIEENWAYAEQVCLLTIPFMP